ncbi:MAG: alpha/beta fold hydrolase [Pseudomonadota bacterium]
MPTFDSGGTNIYYEVHGEGPPVLLTHGYSATAQMWRPQLEALGRSHQLIVWDIRGHGHSAVPADPSELTEAHAVADMTRLLDHLGIERAVIGGLSLGGYLSLAFQLRHPDRTQALLIIDTGPGFKKDAAREAWNRQANAMADEIAAKGVGALSDRSAEMATSQHDDLSGVVLAGRTLLTQYNPSVIESLPHIGCPSLVVVGALDEPFLAASSYMAGKIPDARLEVVADAGHAVNIDQPAAFNAVVGSFLRGLDPA